MDPPRDRRSRPDERPRVAARRRMAVLMVTRFSEDKRYTDPYDPEVQPRRLCLECGMIVGNLGIHDAWHRELDEILSGLKAGPVVEEGCPVKGCAFAQDGHPAWHSNENQRGERVVADGAQPDPSSIQRLLDDGLVALINLAVLWPRGLALRVWHGDDGAAYAMDVYEAGGYIAGFVHTREDRAVLMMRMESLVQAELDREARFTEGSEPERDAPATPGGVCERGCIAAYPHTTCIPGGTCSAVDHHGKHPKSVFCLFWRPSD